MANDLTQNPLLFDTTVTDVPVAGFIYGVKLVAGSANATVVVKDHTTSHILYQASAAANASGPFDAVRVHILDSHTIDVTISGTGAVFLLYEDSGAR